MTCDFDEVLVEKRQCNYIVSNDIELDFRWRETLRHDLYKKLGKYHIDRRIPIVSFTSKLYNPDTLSTTLTLIETELAELKEVAESGGEITISEELKKLYDLEALLAQIKEEYTFILEARDSSIEDRILEVDNRLEEFARIVMEGFREIEG
jgi:hypothetical protein